MASAPPLRLGVILPDDGNDETEWRRLDGWFAGVGLAEAEAVVTASPSDGLHQIDSLLRTGAEAALSAAARRLSGAGCAVVIWACTSGSFVGGLDWATEQARAIGRAAGCPATSTSLALIAALRRLGARRADLLSPYPEAVTQRLVSFLREAAIEIDRSVSLDCPDGAASHALDLRAAAAAMRNGAPGGTTPLMIPDTAIDTLNFVGELEATLRRPVVTANQASLWHGLALLGFAKPLEGAGALFRSPGLAA